MISCPICQSRLKVSKLSCESCKTAYEGSFTLPRMARLGLAHRQLAEAFLLSGGNLKDLAERQGISYPTLRKQVDQMIEALRALRVEDDQKIEDIMTEMETGKISGSQGLRLIKEINGEL